MRLPRQVTIANFHDSGDNFLGASFLWRASIHDVVGAYDENTFGGEDYDFWLRMHLVTKFVHVPDCLYEYRVHDNTLNAKAAELNLFDNVRRLLDLDRERRSVLLARPDGLRDTGQSYWRDPAQYLPALTDRLRVTRYSDADEQSRNDPQDVHLLFIDVPFYKIDLKNLPQADIIVTDDRLTHHWLKRQGWPLTTRIIHAPLDMDAPMVRHAAALALFEKDKARLGHVLTRNLPATEILRPAPRKLLLLTSGWGEGGLEQVVLDLADGLRKKGIGVMIGCTDIQPPPALRSACRRLGIEATGFNKSAMALAEFVRTNSIEVVNYHHASLGAQLLAKRGIPTIYTLHNIYAWKSVTELKQLAGLLESVAGFIAVSRQAAAYACRWLNAEPHKMHVIPNGTALPTMIPSPSRNDNTFTFICVGTFTPNKCQQHLVNAFADVHQIFKRTRLKLVGFTPDKAFLSSLRRRIRELDLEDCVDIVPGAERSAALAMMAQSDCMVLPSIIEGWSIAAAEAMLLGIPMILSDVGSACDLQQLSQSVRVVPGKLPDILGITGEEFYEAVFGEDPAYEKRLALEMVRMIVNSASMKQEATDAVPLASDLLSMDRALDSYLEVLRRV